MNANEKAPTKMRAATDGDSRYGVVDTSASSARSAAA
jgi:hypothetical protein